LREVETGKLHLFRFWRLREIHVCCVHWGKFGVGLWDQLVPTKVLESSVLKFSSAVIFRGIDLHIILKRSKSWRHIGSVGHELGLLEVVPIVQEIYVLLFFKDLLRLWVHEIVSSLLMVDLLSNLDIVWWNT